MNEERSSVYCTNCTRTFIAILDLSLNGNHEITCPHCQHIHYRVVRNGVVTEDRYRSSAGPIYQVITSTTTTASIVSYGNTVSSATTSSWLNRSDFNLVY